ncbi:MAG TPA: hypothetical protein VK468_07710, partial [Pyrinomonadaceae bacterium]|nr:hypothetical protein [Pyrinomonadaceae bacterium]
LAEEIGRAVGVGAHLQELRRTRAGRFDLSRSVTFEKLEASDKPSDSLISMSEAVEHLPKFDLTAERVERTRSGLGSRFDAVAISGEPIRMVGPDGELVAVGVYDETENIVRPKVVLI